MDLKMCKICDSRSAYYQDHCVEHSITLLNHPPAKAQKAIIRAKELYTYAQNCCFHEDRRRASETIVGLLLENFHHGLPSQQEEMKRIAKDSIWFIR